MCPPKTYQNTTGQIRERKEMISEKQREVVRFDDIPEREGARMRGKRYGSETGF